MAPGFNEFIFYKSKCNKRLIMQLLFVAMVIVCFQVQGSNTNTCQAPDYQVNSSCIPSVDTKCRVIVNCRLQQTRDLGELLPYKKVVHTLDLSENGIEEITNNVFIPFKELVILNISYNSLRYIQRNAFNGLEKLQILDLSFNLLHTWDTINITRQLQSLTELDVTSNPRWLPGRRITRLPRLALLKGVVSFKFLSSLSCLRCSLVKDSSRFQYNIDVKPVKISCFQYINFIPHNYSSIWGGNYSISCQEASNANVCQQTNHTVTTHSYYSANNLDVCWREIKKWTLPSIPIGLVAMMINCVVMVTVFCSKRLRNNVAMFFISQMATGDFLMGLFLVSLTVSRRLVSRSEFFDLALSQNSLCGSLLAVFVMAQFLSIIVGFLVVLERYLCIVYSMNPLVRITKDVAYLLMIGVWFITISVCVLPLALKMKLTIGDYSCVNAQTSDGSYFIHYPAILAIAIYTLSHLFYARIFYTVKKSNQSLSIQRDGKLAKRIAMITFSNFLIYLFPMIVYLFSDFEDAEAGSAPASRYILWNTLGYFYLGINSCLNPLFYALRNDRFQSELKRLLKYRRNVVGIAPVNP